MLKARVADIPSSLEAAPSPRPSAGRAAVRTARRAPAWGPDARAHAAGEAAAAIAAAGRDRGRTVVACRTRMPGDGGGCEGGLRVEEDAAEVVRR